MEDLRVVYENRNRRRCADRALVLSSVHIPYQLIDDGMSCALVVPAEHSARAAEELQLYDEENPPVVTRPRKPIVYQDAVPGVAAYAVVVCLVAGMAGFSFFSSDWLAAGRVDGTLIRGGEWWRTITALTLHADLRHLLGNLAFGIFFGVFAGRLLGSGVTWFAVVVAAALGNAANTLLLHSAHRSIGASTAVFATLGLLAGYVWRGRLMAQDRWSTRWGPVVGGLALLMFTGTGDANTDIGAHLMGFVCGFGAGMMLTLIGRMPAPPHIQRAAGGAALGLVALAWSIALAT
ncbi:MAG: rhomboid family intramembrane serine protease [Gammaproteobacteria bacterium]|nr:rhomboid family intramembrane serine protease [Gammaproteobacteria bacterium]NNF48301.1 rhomboid family intramembrane serine protease [Woeseiaceae bacterium]MBT8093915.1 rhomboid family intramembrane serine protease [Gammaproteobacteria bacterium]MBT8105491.1 rhomboid family intramembrane serine protease [Gammaproteobacteria bacterium]NNK25505.1 rhomboid family intramembrane serine protease [Woeseiaceae bacterium]